MGDNNVLERIDVETILREGMVDGKKPTILKLFRLNILFRYVTKGRRYLSYRGSVVVRIGTLRKLKMGSTSSLPLETIGKIFQKVSGREDEFIVSRLEKNIPVNEIITEFLQEVRTYL
ncbi:MAG: hypothetical protein WB948_00255 [Desulfobaccales bacterium]